MNLLNTTTQIDTKTLVYVVAALLSSPFLKFVLDWSRRRVDKDNIIVTGAGDAVEALNESLTGVRADLAEVRRDRDGDRTEFRKELDAQQSKHEREMAALKQSHLREMESLRLEHRQEIRALEGRLNGH